MRSFNESQIMTEEKFVSCVRYIEENPVRRGLAATAGSVSLQFGRGSCVGPDASASCGEIRPGPKGPLV